MKNTSIKNKKAAASRILSEFGKGADNEMLELLQPWFPQPETTSEGIPFYSPDEVQAFDALFERFGVRFRSSDDRFYDIFYVSKLWFRLTSSIGGYIECSRHSPKLFEHLVKEMPADFRDYTLAVMRNDQPETQRLARKLDIENLDAFCIKGIFEG